MHIARDLVLPTRRSPWRCGASGRATALQASIAAVDSSGAQPFELGKPVRVIDRCRGVNLSVPAEVEGTLARRYGPNWRTPAYAEKGADTGEGRGTGCCWHSGSFLSRRAQGGWRQQCCLPAKASACCTSMLAVEGSKPYMRLFRALARIGIRI